MLKFRFENNSVECFSSPFNRYHNYYCAVFKDLDPKLGAIGSYFDIMTSVLKGTYKFPVNNLEINPVFVEYVMNYAIELALKVLYMENNSYKMSFVLPDWDNFEAKTKLLELEKNSKLTVSFKQHKKGSLPFKQYFTGKSDINPCDIIIISVEKK